MSIFKWLGFGFAGAEPEDVSLGDTNTVRKITQALDELDRDQARLVAAFAYVLSRVANADLEISEEETRAMERAVVEWGHLPEEQAIIVVQMAKSHSQLFGSTEDYLVTREFDGMASREQKMDLVHCLFAVAAADESISSVEENEIRQISNQLGLSHKDYIAIRIDHAQHLDVLKGG